MKMLIPVLMRVRWGPMCDHATHIVPKIELNSKFVVTQLLYLPERLHCTEVQIKPPLAHRGPNPTFSEQAQTLHKCHTDVGACVWGMGDAYNCH